MSIGRRAMDPPVPVFCCTIITRSGIVSNVLSIAMNDSELLIDRAASYRVFVTRLHEHLARAESDALHLAGAASQQRGLRRVAATAVTTVAAFLLLPKPFGLGSSAMIAALILGLAAMVLYLLAREPSPDERFRRYDRAAIPEDFLPPEIQG
jgi:hypothetical protein